MSRRRQRIELWMTVVLLALFGIAGGYWYFGILNRRDLRGTRSTPFAPTLPEPEEPAVPIVDAAPAAEPRELPITVFVFDRDGRPVAPGRVEAEVGDDRATTDSTGILRFPARRRSPRSDGRFAIAGRNASEDAPEPGANVFAVPGLLTGDPTGTAVDLLPIPDALALEPLRLPERPGRLVWTLIVPSSAAPGVPDGSSAASPSEPFWITVDWVLAEEWEGGARVRVEGRSNLPDGASIDTSLEFDGQRTASSFASAHVDRGSWRGVLALPLETKLFAGEYLLHASFNPRLESAETIGSWPSRVADSIVESVEGEVHCERSVRFGDPEEARREDIEVERYYRRVLATAHAWDGALRSRLEEVVLLGQGWDPRVIAAHEEAHATWFQERLVALDGTLAETAWRHFLDEEWRPAVEEALEQHRARSLVKYRVAESRMDSLLGSLLSLSQLHSMLRVYPLFGLPTHPNDDYNAGGDANGDLALLESRLEDNFHALERFTRLTSGAAPPVEAAPEPSPVPRVESRRGF